MKLRLRTTASLMPAFTSKPWVPCFALFLVFSCSSALAQSSTAGAANPIDRYRAAEKTLAAHTKEYDFLHDDSPAAIAALKAMWAASADAVIEQLASNPKTSATDIDRTVCQLEPEAYRCNIQGPVAPEDVVTSSDVIQLGAESFAVSQFNGEVGTVFIVGPREGKPALLWSISSTLPQSLDRQGIIGAWRVERAGGACRDKGTKFKPGQCGPLYASLGVLPADAEGRPRFYINGGYAQMMGATIGEQATVWRWNGVAAELLWEDWYDFMIDQAHGSKFKDGILTFEAKEDFRTFFGCGSCEARQMQRRLRVTPGGIEDLGKVSLRPELDLIDELFWRLARGQSTADIASPQVAMLLKPQIADAKRESRKIARNWLSVGMLGDVAHERTGDLDRVCFTADDIGRITFTIQENQGKPFYLSHAEEPPGNYGDCAKPLAALAK